MRNFGETCHILRCCAICMVCFHPRCASGVWFDSHTKSVVTHINAEFVLSYVISYETKLRGRIICPSWDDLQFIGFPISAIWKCFFLSRRCNGKFAFVMFVGRAHWDTKRRYDVLRILEYLKYAIHAPSKFTSPTDKPLFKFGHPHRPPGVGRGGGVPPDSFGSRRRRGIFLLKKSFRFPFFEPQDPKIGEKGPPRRGLNKSLPLIEAVNPHLNLLNLSNSKIPRFFFWGELH